MAIVRVHYEQDGTPRFIRGILLEENQDYVKIQLEKYVVTISKKVITKLEVAR